MNAPLHAIISAIGLPAALKLVEVYGGVRIYLPLPGNITSENSIAALIGVDKARALASVWSQERPTLPRAADYLRRERDRVLRREKKSMSVRDLAMKYGLTERAVYLILAAGDTGADENPSAPSPQASLF